jgi:hypothetical protein
MALLLLLLQMVQHSINTEGIGSPFPFSFLQQIGSIVVIGLAAREDRWQRCEEIFKQNKITKVTRYVTTKDEKDIYGHAVKDFLNLLRLKKGNLVFFEDDFELTNGWEDILIKAWKGLPSDFDLLYFGANLTESAKRVTSSLVKVRGAWCLHAAVFSEKFVNYVLRNYEYPRCGVMDEWIRAQSDVRKFYMVYPMIAYQRKGYSDYQNKEVEYNLFENKYYKKL